MMENSISTSPQLSVIIPASGFNEYLSIALSSVFEQKFDDYEVIVCVNGPNAYTVESSIRSKYGDKIRIISTLERGIALALNLGVREARAPLIARMDSDDISFPERFARQVAFMKSHPDVDVVGTRVLVFRDRGGVVGLLPFAQSHAKICARPYNGILLAHATWVGRTEWFRKNPYYVPEFRRAEDQELLLRTYNSSTFACLQDVLYAYRQGDFSASKTLSGRTSLLRAQFHHFRQNGEFGSLCKSFFLYCLKLSVDFAASIPGFDYLYFMRMNEVPDQKTIELFYGLAK